MGASLKGNCVKCGRNSTITEHHLFNYFDIKRKLLQIFPKPETDREHDMVNGMVKSMHRTIPTVMLCRLCHDVVE